MCYQTTLVCPRVITMETGFTVLPITMVITRSWHNNYTTLTRTAPSVAMGDSDLSATPLSDLPASPTPPPATLTEALPEEMDKATSPKKNRCFSCRKKVGLTGQCQYLILDIPYSTQTRSNYWKMGFLRILLLLEVCLIMLITVVLEIVMIKIICEYKIIRFGQF